MKRRKRKSFCTIKDVDGFLKFEYPEQECIGFAEGFYYYDCTCPLDDGWEFLPTADDFADKLFRMENDDPFCEWRLFEQFTQDLRAAKNLLNKMGFDHEYYGIRLLWFPLHESLEYAFLTKTSDNGTTVIISKFDLDKWGKECLNRY